MSRVRDKSGGRLPDRDALAYLRPHATASASLIVVKNDVMTEIPLTKNQLWNMIRTGIELIDKG